MRPAARVRTRRQSLGSHDQIVSIYKFFFTLWTLKPFIALKNGMFISIDPYEEIDFQMGDFQAT